MGDNGSIVSDSEFVNALKGAQNSVDMSSYLMPKGPVLDALVNAAKHGAQVHLTLAGDSFANSMPDIKKANDYAAMVLRKAGATVDFNTGQGGTPLHMKACVIDGQTGYLNERNWPNDGKDDIVKITDPQDLKVVQAGVGQKAATSAHLSSDKDTALQMEADTIAKGSGPLRVETESFGPGKVADAIMARAKAGDNVELIVVKSDVGAQSLAELQALAKAGVAIRLNEGTGGEKMALQAGQGWVGSANATEGRPHTIDWGMQTTNQSTLSQLSTHFNDQWSNSTPFDPNMEIGKSKTKNVVER